MGKPTLLYDNRFLDGTITATETASGYDVNNIKDLRSYTFWKGASAGRKYLTVNCGWTRSADTLALMGHNFGTAQADVTVESSNDGSAWTKRVNVGKAVFTRASAAYQSDATQVTSGNTRYENGKNDQAIMAEEGTTNLLSASQASVETDITGFTAVNSATLTRDTTRAWHGAACLKIVTPGTAAFEGVVVPYVTATQGTYIGQVRARGAGTIAALVRISYSDLTMDNTAYVTKTLDDAGWAKIETPSLASTAAKTVSSVEIHVRTYNTAQAATYYVDGLQLETKNHTTSWHLPSDGSRAAETISFNPDGALSVSAGTIAFWAYITPSSQHNAGNQYLFSHATDYASPYRNVIAVRHSSNGTWHAWFTDANGNQTTTSGPASLIDGWHIFAVRWIASSSSCCLFIDGTKYVATFTNKPTAAGTAAYIGSWAGSMQANNLIDDFRMYNRDLSDTEIGALYSASAPSRPDSSTVALYDFNGSLLSGLIPDDTAFLRNFTKTAAKYWRIGVITPVVQAQLAVVMLGERLTFERYLQAPFDPAPEKIEGDSQRSKTGNLLGSVVYYHSMKISADFKNVTPTWIRDRLKPAWDFHLSLLKPFFFAWDPENHPDEVFFVKVPENFELRMPYDGVRRSLRLEFEGVKE